MSKNCLSVCLCYLRSVSTLDIRNTQFFILLYLLNGNKIDNIASLNFRQRWTEAWTKKNTFKWMFWNCIEGCFGSIDFQSIAHQTSQGCCVTLTSMMIGNRKMHEMVHKKRNSYPATGKINVITIENWWAIISMFTLLQLNHIMVIQK